MTVSVLWSADYRSGDPARRGRFGDQLELDERRVLDDRVVRGARCRRRKLCSGPRGNFRVLYGPGHFPHA